MASAYCAPVEVGELRTEYQVNPLGIDVLQPRFSWQIRSSSRGLTQEAYQIRVAKSEENLRRGIELAWDAGKIRSGESIQIEYSGVTLRSRQRYCWQVRTWSTNGVVSQWSGPASFEMGLLTPAEWQAQWIEPTSDSPQVPILRREFSLRGEVKRARVYATSHGLYRLFINGERVGDLELTPGFTSYHKRLQYQTYDVTRLVRKGQNAVGALLSDGWYRNFRSAFGDRLGLLMQLEVTYADGTTDLVLSDGHWKSGRGPILTSGIYAGETYDARLEQEGWSNPGFDARAWQPIAVVNRRKDVLVAQSGPPVRRVEEVTPKRISRTESGVTIVDMGQNMVGWVRLSVQGPAGTTVVLRHGEVLDRQGNLYTENLGGAEQTERYTLKGGGVEVYEPHFTFHGFRYVAVEGYPGELTADRIAGRVVHSDFDRAGEFETSNPLLNQLHSNIVWSLKGNSVDIPTDNPQRSERLGWTGDAQVFLPTAAFNANVAGFFAKWLRDLAVDQSPNGSVRWVAPEVVHEIDFQWMTGAPESVRKTKQDAGGVAGWGDAATVVPWLLYSEYGDRRVLETQYDSMSRWVAYVERRAGADLIWDGDFQFGDHADITFETFGIPEGNYSSYGGATDRDLIATAYFARSADLLSRAARVLGKREDSLRAAALFADIRAAFQRRFVTPDAKVGQGTQTSYVLALQFDLLPANQRAAAARHLADDAVRQGHLTTGLLGSPGLLFALSEQGHLEEAYRLLLREEYPSWLYPLEHDATTIWERWDGIEPDGSIPSGVMRSFNQYALGSVGNWMYRVVGGMDADPRSPAHRHALIAPRPGGGLTWARTRHMTPYGAASIYWRTDVDTFRLQVEIPGNTTATVRLPFARRSAISEGRTSAAEAVGVLSLRQSGTDVNVEVGSGKYDFSYRLSP